jgi:hypothetical protein
MADELPAGSRTLEDGPAPEPVPAPEPPAPLAEPVEPGAVDVGGQQMVPLSALLAERTEKKALKERAGQLEHYAQQTKPYVDFLQQNPDLLKRPQAAPPEPPKTADPRAVKWATKLSLYTPDGKLDVDTAAELLNDQAEVAKQQAQTAVQPWMENTAQERSARNYHAAVNATGPNGVKPDAAVLTNLWRALPANLTADPNVSTILQLAAVGAAAMGQRQQVAPQPNPPLITEGSGGQPRPAGALTALEQRVAENRGVSQTKWAELGTGFVKGRSSNLED